MPKEKLEAVATTEELIESVKDLICQCCRCTDIDNEDVYDSMGISTNADAMRLLARLGIFEITSQYGRRVIGKFTEKKIRPDLEAVHTEMLMHCETRMEIGEIKYGNWKDKPEANWAVQALEEAADLVNYLRMEAESTGNDLTNLSNAAFDLGKGISWYLRERDK